MPTGARVNMSTIAKDTGYSIATVSMALRGFKKIPLQTRKKIIAAAGKRGYHVDPVLSKAFSFARRPSHSRYRETMGMILEFPLEQGPSYQKAIFTQAKKHAEDLGYKIDPFHVSGSAVDQHQADRMLLARGIRGLIILPRVGTRYPRLRFSWEKFAAVEIGRNLWYPRDLHRVERAVYFELIESFHLLKKAGYQRIGMAVEPTADAMRLGLYTAAYLVAEKRSAIPLVPSLTAKGEWSEKAFRLWYKKYKPDVVIIHRTDKVPAWIAAMGLSIPEDISIFGCNVRDSGLSGITSNLQMYGERSVDLLSILLERNELGSEREPDCWLLRGSWINGHSLAKPLKFAGHKNEIKLSAML